MPKDGKQYDRSAEDLGNIVGLEHVNLQVEDQGLTTLFYISGLGLTRDRSTKTLRTWSGSSTPC